MMVKRVMNQVQKLDPFYDENFVDHTLQITKDTSADLIPTYANSFKPRFLQKV